MRRLLIILAALCALPATAHAGGWATVGLSSTPDGLAPGATWRVDVEVLQHGRTPLAGVEPAIVLGDGTRVPADPTTRPGVYRADVRLPDARRVSYTVDDGFGGRHRFGTARLADDADTSWLAAPAAGLALLLLGALHRRRAR